jgi:hypothetical protein
VDCLLCRYSVAGLYGWKDVFDHEAWARRKAAGLKLLHILRCSADPNCVFLLFRVEDMEKALAFTGESAGGAEEIEFLKW